MYVQMAFWSRSGLSACSVTYAKSVGTSATAAAASAEAAEVDQHARAADGGQAGDGAVVHGEPGMRQRGVELGERGLEYLLRWSAAAPKIDESPTTRLNGTPEQKSSPK